MTTYRTNCPHCQVGIKYNEKLFGQTRPCPNCRMQIILQAPSEGDALAAGATGGFPASAPPSAAMPPAAPQSQELGVPGWDAPLSQPPRVPARPQFSAPPPPPPPQFRAPPLPAAPPPLAQFRAPLPPVAPPPPPAPPTPPQFEGPPMPERMKANRVLAGRVCRGCNIQVELGDEVYNCQKCGATMHLACHEKQGGCARCVGAAASTTGADFTLAPDAVMVQPIDMTATVPCRFCGEQIMVGSRKCRYCGEYQSDADRALMQRQVQATKASDSKLEGYEILIALIPCNLGCIWGIVLAAQGKPKGWKMLGINLAVQIGAGILLAMLGAFNN